MYCIQDAEFAGVNHSGRLFTFKKLGTTCPFCARKAWFVFAPDVSRQDIGAAPRRVDCPGCSNSVSFFVISPPYWGTSGWLWADPSPETAHLHRGEIASALASVDPALREAYEEATTTLASGHASSATIQARRTLEGLVKHLLHDEGQEVSLRTPLNQLIKKLSDQLDLAKPLKDTAHAVREGGNLGAHYDARTTATPDLARRTVELVEAIADYLLVLPDKVEELRALLEPGPAEEEDAAADPGSSDAQGVSASSAPGARAGT